ncbi:MAG: hypothetical protein K0R14_1217 [Burkholderiales bacterium]|jgi:hypothetical protein|nr:hypothetical protein [Burkholderiales bacterium]
MKSTSLTEEIANFHQNVMDYESLKAENLLSILGPLNAKLENTATIIDVI